MTSSNIRNPFGRVAVTQGHGHPRPPLKRALEPRAARHLLHRRGGPARAIPVIGLS